VPARIALAGADIDAHCGDTTLPGWRPIKLPAGSGIAPGCLPPRCPCLSGRCRRHRNRAGCWAAAPPTCALDSAGVAGRALCRGDILPMAADPSAACELRVATWWIDPKPDLDLSPGARVHLLPGRDATAPAESITHQTWRVAEASNRQGLRLQGNALALSDPGERLSAPTLPGAVQLPPDGRPIVLLADAQTIGGYPASGRSARADLPRLAQCRPGDSVHFQPIDRARSAGTASRPAAAAGTHRTGDRATGKGRQARMRGRVPSYHPHMSTRPSVAAALLRLRPVDAAAVVVDVGGVQVRVRAVVGPEQAVGVARVAAVVGDVSARAVLARCAVGADRPWRWWRRWC
jgi:allophanate hydrolase subunit 2